MMVNDIFNSMMYQEEMRINRISVPKPDVTPKVVKSRNSILKPSLKQENRTYDLPSARNSDTHSYYKRPSTGLTSEQHESFERNPTTSMFEVRRFTNKENIIEQLKKKHKFESKIPSKKRKSSTKHKFKHNNSKSRSDISSEKYSKSRSRNRSQTGSITERSYVHRNPVSHKFSNADRFKVEPDRSPGPCYYLSKTPRALHP